VTGLQFLACGFLIAGGLFLFFEWDARLHPVRKKERNW
jgi:hypothetical protein